MEMSYYFELKETLYVRLMHTCMCSPRPSWWRERERERESIAFWNVFALHNLRDT